MKAALQQEDDGSMLWVSGVSDGRREWAVHKDCASVIHPLAHFG